MVTYAEGRIKKENKECLENFQLIKQLLDLANFSVSINLNCHILSLALADMFKLKVEHGFYLPGYEHSWCIDGFGNIIDVYPWGCIGGPILIAKEVAHSLKFNGLYQVNEDIFGLKSPQLQTDIVTVKTELTNLLSKLKAV